MIKKTILLISTLIILSNLSKAQEQTKAIKENKYIQIKLIKEITPELKEYFEQTNKIIRSKWTPPEKFKNKGLTTVLIITIMKNGNIDNYKIEKASGNKEYDKMIIDTLNKLTPLPPIPNTIKEETLQIGLRF